MKGKEKFIGWRRGFFIIFVRGRFASVVGRGGWITRSGVRNQPGQHGKTPSLLKIQKISLGDRARLHLKKKKKKEKQG